jgi:secondary thiamine-phosphate synthase enzyme
MNQTPTSLSSTIVITTTRAPEFIDITERVLEIVQETHIRNGLVSVFSKHTTAAIKLNENEPLLIKDMEGFLSRIAPVDAYYQHNDFSIRTVNMTEDECPNGHAHCQHLLLSSSETIPLFGGALQIGTWQRLFLVELDRAREREIVVQVIGA